MNVPPAAPLHGAQPSAAPAEPTERQLREIEYHREHARQHRRLLEAPFDRDVLENPERKWWNAYWRMFACLKELGVAGRRVLVVGCGFGDDAIRLAMLGGDVHAFDISPESLSIARALASREGARVRFERMPAEKLDYPDAHFDLVVVRDILHHVDIPAAMAELARVAAPGAHVVIDEIYSHSWTERIRRSHLVEGVLYPKMRQLIYGTARPYITADERKMTERDVEVATRRLRILREEHFDLLVNRVLPDYSRYARFDRAALRALAPFGRWLAGRILIVGQMS